MGTVYLAQHPRLPRQDALKILNPALGRDSGLRARFLREAELAARVEHPNVVSVYDRGSVDDLLWIAMRYVDGLDAAALIRYGPTVLTPDRVLRIVSDAARGLDAAHRSGLLHRDVKPANILISAGDDGADIARITDFGIARSVDAVTNTTTGSVLASFAYASPEQLNGEPLDPRTDVYSLGCSLYEMLTGAPPFERRSAIAVMTAHLTEPPPRPSAVNPALPEALDVVIARALAKHRDERYAGCGELADAANAAFATAIETPTELRSAVPARSRPRWAVLAAAAASLLITAATTAGIQMCGNASAHPKPAPTAASTTARTTTTAAPSAWGPGAYIVAAFPGLLPADPTATGYQGMRCALNDAQGRWVQCPAGDDSAFSVNIHCDPSRSQLTYSSNMFGRSNIHEEHWTHASGSGSVRWATDSLAGFGLLDVEFDDPGRWFCIVTASGGTGGQDVAGRWWAHAPL
ncbi:serine/threonine protein kinase [Nocardia sp. NEAU-G5]|uniref:non-specific serine/threonine protein kinase n=2 Tax=Nocardia albiluteola TaxID=2842303 RepID=A0ABS6B4Q6_9NOCA|nr:serine/threonine protein kinase [Nocardia albiluteola]